MKSLIKNHPQTITGLLAFLAIASGIAIFLFSLSANQLALLINY